MRVTLVHNPTAGDERHSAEDLLEELAKAGYEARLVSGKKRLGQVLQDPGELVVVAGGDGSVKRVALALAGRAVPMAILPIGLANNIAKSLGVFGAVSELVAGWRRAERRRLRVGTVATRSGAMRFTESAGVGVFAELVIRGEEEVDNNAGGFTGPPIDRALLLLQRIVAERAPGFRRLSLDATDLSGEYLMVEAMNIPFAGPNVPLAPAADFSDGRLDLVTISGRERKAVAEYVRARLAGEAAPLELPVRRGERVLLGATPGELHVDDEAWKPEPARASAAGSERPEGEVSITLEDQGVEVLVTRKVS